MTCELCKDCEVQEQCNICGACLCCWGCSVCHKCITCNDHEQCLACNQPGWKPPDSADESGLRPLGGWLKSSQIIKIRQLTGLINTLH